MRGPGRTSSGDADPSLLERAAELVGAGRTDAARSLLAALDPASWARRASSDALIRAARLAGELELLELGAELLERRPDVLEAAPEGRLTLARLLVRQSRDEPSERVRRLRSAEAQLRALGLAAPRDPRPHALLGLVLDRQGRFAEAVESWRSAWVLEPTEVGHELGLAAALCASGRYREAVGHFERVARARPLRAEARLNLGLALREAGEPERALEAFEAAAELAPERARVHVERGLALRSLGRVDDALGAFDRALRLDPESGEAHHQKGRLLVREGRLEEAREALEAARARAPNDPAVHRALAELARVPMGEDEDTVAILSPSPPDLVAEVARFPVPEIVEFLGMSRRSGILEVEARSTRGELELLEGRLLSGRVEGQPSFLERLIEAGVLVPPGLGDFELGRGAAPLLEVLADERIGDEATYERVAFESSVDAVLALVRLDEGRAEFRARASEPSPVARFGVNAQGVLLEAYRRIDEAG